MLQPDDIQDILGLETSVPRENIADLCDYINRTVEDYVERLLLTHRRECPARKEFLLSRMTVGSRQWIKLRSN